MSDIYSDTALLYAVSDIIQVILKYEIFKGSNSFITKQKVMHFKVLKKIKKISINDFLTIFVL